VTTTCAAFLGVSMDGFIAGPDGDLAWLDATPNPTESDMGYNDFISSVDAIVMGRRTFETVLGFDGDWPYTIPVVVMSRSWTEVPIGASNTELTSLPPAELVSQLEGRGMSKLYIDGGAVVTSFLDEGLLDEITTTTIPVALGSGNPLFGKLSSDAWFDVVTSTVLIDALVQTTYRRRP
jgi:dihydrofolate reductase